MRKNKESINIIGEKWIWASKANSFTRGNTISFLPNGIFTEKIWYSGGSYFTYDYSGKYYLDEKQDIVFLRYDKPKTKIPKKNKLAIKLIKTEANIQPLIYQDWKIINGEYLASKKDSIVVGFDTTPFALEKYTFKIEKIASSNP